MMKPEDILHDRLEEIIGHLGAAIQQSIASDDQIIMSHVRNAYAIAKAIRDEPYAISSSKALTDEIAKLRSEVFRLKEFGHMA